MFPKLIEIDGFFLGSYGLMVALGLLGGLWVAQRLARRSGLNPEAIVNLGVYCVLAGVAGAKLLMFAVDYDYYRANPGEIFSLSTLRAGGVFYGGLILALATGVLYMRRQRLPGLATADALAPGVALGHALGRVGCFLAGCCWGTGCNLPWAVTFTNPDAHQLFGTPLARPLHPTQLYESLAEAAIFTLLWVRFPFRRRPGEIIGLYLVLYSTARFLVEFVRAHDQPNPFGGSLSTSQWIALVLAASGAWLLGRRQPAK